MCVFVGGGGAGGWGSGNTETSMDTLLLDEAKQLRTATCVECGEWVKSGRNKEVIKHYCTLGEWNGCMQ